MAALGCWLIVIPTSLLTNYTGVGVAGHIGTGGVREIQAHLQEVYGAEVSPTLISSVTDAVMDEVSSVFGRRQQRNSYFVGFVSAVR